MLAPSKCRQHYRVEGRERTLWLITSETIPKIHQLPLGGPDNPAWEEQRGLGAGAAQRPCGNQRSHRDRERKKRVVD